MFTTDAIDEVCSVSRAMLPGDTRLWKRLSTESPFFQVSATPGLLAASDDEALLISDPYDLARLAAAVRILENSDLGEVMISTPSSVNGCGRWLHQTLYAMFFAIHKVTGRCSLVYLTSGGIYGVETEAELRQYSKEVLYHSSGYALNIFDDYIDTRRIKVL
jgi:hypothetical protein